jgi:hypothetical protein
MFRYIFDKIDKPDREAAARLFLTMNLQFHTTVHFFADGTFRRLNSSIYIHSLLDEINDNPAYEKSLMEGTLGPPIRLEEWEARCLAMNHRLTGRCQGLIVVWPPNRATRVTDEIQFVHRTVRDFLNQSEIRDIIQDAAGDFDPFRALPLSLLATLKHTPKTSNMDALVRPEDAAHTLMQHWSYSEISGRGTFLPEFASMTSMLIELNKKLSPEGGFPGIFNQYWNWNRLIGPTTAGETETAILIQAIQARAFSTALERLKGSRLECSWFLVAASIQTYWIYSGPRHADFTDIIVFLLRYETSINGELPGFCNLAYHFNFHRQVANRGYALHSSSVPWTLWTLLLREAAEDMFESRWRGFKAPPNLERSLEMLLKQGADPNVCFIGYDVSKTRAQAHRNTGGEFSGLSHLRNVLRGPLSMDLSSLFSIWGFGIDCGDSAGSTEGSTVVVHETKALSICTQGEETLIKSSLVGNCDSDVSFIVVNVVARDQMARLQTPGIEKSLNEMLREKLGDLLRWFPQ